MGQIQFTVSLIMIGLFSIAIMGFAINFAAENNSVIDIADDPEIASLDSQIGLNVDSFREDSENTYQSIIESSINPEGFTSPKGGQFAITPVAAVGVTKNILETGYIKIFGNDDGFGIFITTFLSLIVFILGLLIWKTWAGRNPN